MEVEGFAHASADKFGIKRIGKVEEDLQAMLNKNAASVADDASEWPVGATT